ncbi:MAG: galactose-1-phosphate uridylyltransferase [Cryobacterium sp.]|nr:galactose-1-phosphate uridylyltransferase [Oligoflexia bacterium]
MNFFSQSLKKPDGRDLFLYSTRPIESGIVPTNPKHDAVTAKPEFRWHPFRGEWVAYASHRQNRTFLPPKDYSPLAVTKSSDFPTEMPAGDYEVAVFENLFPSLNTTTDPVAPSEIIANVPTRAAEGRCEVVVFTKDPDTSLGALPVERIRLILDVLAERTLALSRERSIRYVLPFENRGVEMGVTLHHPHSQLYAYPFVPPVPAKMLESMSAHYEKTGRGLFKDLIDSERKDGRRIIVDEELQTGEASALSFVPAFARYPYETWIAPSKPRAFLHELNDAERDSLARVLKKTILKHDALWNRPQPYLMILYQAPLDGAAHPEAHVHFEIYPPYRTKDRLKYLAGTELGGGMFVNDSVPEEKAAELRAAQEK